VSPDGAHIAFGRGDVTRNMIAPWGRYYNGWLGREIWTMRSDGADQIKLAADKSDGSALGAPTWSPDSKRIAYVRTTWGYDPPTSSVEVNDWRTQSRDLFSAIAWLTLHWLPDGSLIYAAPQAILQRDSHGWCRCKNLENFWFPKRITQGHGSILYVAGSIDGKVVVFLSEHWSPSVYIGALAPDGAPCLRTAD
jgi:hypothetical protein